METKTPAVAAFRRFSRFYTRVLGLLDSRLLSSEFTLSELRVLYEIGTMERCTSKQLIEWLNIDAGYLSRIMKRFEKEDLAYKVQSPEDGRSYLLHLTDKGRETLARMDALSDGQVRELIGGLSERELTRLSDSMKFIESALAEEKRVPQIDIRTEIRPGDLGMLIHLHGWIYALECGYNHVFEAYVCKTFYDWMRTYDPDTDRLWIAEADGQIVGSLAIVGKPDNRAQLRWFIVHPDYRGTGLGSRLFREAMDYCQSKAFDRVFLETTDDQEKAIGMYAKAGFRQTGEQANEAWGVRHTERTYELDLTAAVPHSDRQSDQ